MNTVHQALNAARYRGAEHWEDELADPAVATAIVAARQEVDALTYSNHSAEDICWHLEQCGYCPERAAHALDLAMADRLAELHGYGAY